VNPLAVARSCDNASHLRATRRLSPR
jgi:hypothetical protein